eukprot:2737301-Pyramimonas_sp.AAC.2
MKREPFWLNGIQRLFDRSSMPRLSFDRKRGSFRPKKHFMLFSQTVIQKTGQERWQSTVEFVYSSSRVLS